MSVKPLNMRIVPSELSVPKLHGYLLSSIGPRPIALASTVDKDGNRNLSPFSFFNVFSANPPIVIFSPARRGRDNTTKHTYENVKEVSEVVINVVNNEIVQQVSLSSTEYEKGVDEFVKSGLTPIDSETIRPARVKEFKLEVPREEAESYTMELLKGQFAQYGQQEPDEEMLRSTAQSLLQNSEEAKRIFDQLYDRKMMEYVKANLKIKEKKISYDDFLKLARK